MSIGTLSPQSIMPFSVRYYEQPVVFVLPHSRQYTAIEKLLLPFDRALWLSCVAAYAVACVLLGRLSVGRKPHSAWLDVFSVFIGSGFLPYEQRTANAWLLLWLLVTLVLRSLYQSFMFTFMQQNVQVLPPDTIADMNEQGYRYMCDSESVLYFESFEILHNRCIHLT